MIVLIDIPQEMFKATQTYYSNNTTRLSIKSCIEKIANGTPIPDNPTNGDMIKAMFPNAETWVEYDSSGDVMRFDIAENSTLECFNLEWWNAPYERGSENDSNTSMYRTNII